MIESEGRKIRIKPTITLDADTYEALMDEAAECGASISSIVVAALKEYLQGYPEDYVFPSGGGEE